MLAGDLAARQILYDKYAGALYGVVLQLVPVKEQANEVLVKVFTYAFQNIRGFTESGHFSLFAWLMKQAREISLREAPSVPVTTEANPGEQQLALRNNHYIQRFTANLPEQNSQIFRLCYYKGLSTQAVANLLGRNEEEVKQSLQAAMVEFRKYLQTNWS